MDVTVLVGGEGTRLRPLTYDTPKQMLPVVDRPMIEHVLATVVGKGVERAVLSLGYRPDAFTRAFPSGTIDDLPVVYATDPEPLDTAGAVRYAAEVGEVKGRFLVLNGDVLTDFDVSTLVEFHDEHDAEASIYLTPVAEPSAFGVVPTREDGSVVAFVEKPPPGTAPTNLINAGMYLFEQSVLDRIPLGRRASIERETFPALVENQSLFAVASDAYWLDTGTPAKFLEAQLDILHGCRTARSRPRGEEIAPGVFRSEGAELSGELAGAGYLGPGAVVSSGAVVEDSVIGAGARVLSGAKLTRSAVLPEAVVGEGCEVSDSIVGAAAIVGRGARLELTSVVQGGVEVPSGAVLSGSRYPQ
jgi:mannose-1-phosphate guanylyltransferase